MNTKHPIEIKIIDLLSARNEEAIKLVYHNYGKALFSVIYRIVGKKDDTDEVLQDVLVKIWEKSSLYDESKGRLYTWMLNIARNTAIDRLKSKNFKQDKNTQGSDDFAVFDTGVRGVIPENIGVRELTNILEEEQKAVIDLAYFQGYTQKEIAEKLEMPLGSVKTKVRYALNSLRDYLKDEY